MSGGWIGSLRHVLARAEITHSPRPDNDTTVVEIPNGLERLRKAIVMLQNEIVEAQAERGDYIQAWKDCRQEIAAALSKNETRQRDLRHRMTRLQDEWVRVTVDLGIRAEIVPPTVDSSMPDGMSGDVDTRDKKREAAHTVAVGPDQPPQ